MDRRTFFKTIDKDRVSTVKNRWFNTNPDMTVGLSAPVTTATYDLSAIKRPDVSSPSVLNKYTGALTFSQVAHILKRTCFGASIPNMLKYVGQPVDTVVNDLLSSYPIPPPPVNPKEVVTDPMSPDYNVTGDFIGVSSPYSAPLDKQRNDLVRQQWNDLIVNSPINIRERMVTFLSGLLVTTGQSDARFFFSYVNLLRTYATGNYKDLLKQLTINPNMLVYLNGYQSTKAAPNENFGRELQELFTIGKGPEISGGNYTNYTEQDVQAAARVLTGWRVDAYQTRGLVGSHYDDSQHDTSNKQFSADYQNHIIANNGANEYADLIDMIFNEAETARYFVRKLYRQFVYYYIDPSAYPDLTLDIEKNVIEPLAQTFRSVDPTTGKSYELIPLLRQLLQSQHFFDTLNIGCIIKDPITFAANNYRVFGVSGDAIGDAASCLMALGGPPLVAGWPGNYEAPSYHEWWINAISLEARISISDAVVKNNGDAIIAMANLVGTPPFNGDPSDPNSLITVLATFLFPSELTTDYSGPITQKQHDYLKGILLPGLPDFEWNAQIWGPAKTGTDPAAKQVLVARLTGLFTFMLSMAEYHLS